MVQIGLRGSIDSGDELDWAIARGVRIIRWRPCSTGACRRFSRRPAAIAGRGGTYLSFDIDALDPAYAPGTGTPEMGGFTAREALQIVRSLRGVDLVGAVSSRSLPPRSDRRHRARRRHPGLRDPVPARRSRSRTAARERLTNGAREADFCLGIPHEVRRLEPDSHSTTHRRPAPRAYACCSKNSPRRTRSRSSTSRRARRGTRLPGPQSPGQGAGLCATARPSSQSRQRSTSSRGSLPPFGSRPAHRRSPARLLPALDGVLRIELRAGDRRSARSSANRAEGASRPMAISTPCSPP